MISKHNLLALRNALNDVLGELKESEPPRKRLSKSERLMKQFEESCATSLKKDKKQKP